MGGASCVVSALSAVAFAGCAATILPPTPGGVLLTEALAAEVRALGQRAVLQDGMVGLSIGIAIDGELVLAEDFGHADAARTIPVTRDTVYDIASVGKHFTAAAILRLVEAGRLSLDDRARELVPELPPHFPDATVEQLLRHTSGFVSADLDELDPPADYATKRYGLELLTDVELMTGAALFAPGETCVYSNAGYLVLGLIIEAASGRRYDAFVREELLLPNGLSEMTVCERHEGPRMSAALHRTAQGVAPVPFIDMTAYGGQGSICSSVVDLLRWSRALNAGRVVSLESLALMRSPSVLRGTHASCEVPYGFAQRLGVIGAHERSGHTGTFEGGSAALAYYPDARLEVAVVTNTHGAGTPHAYELELAVAKALLGFVEEDLSSRRAALTPAQERSIEGIYSDGQWWAAAIEGDELVVLRDGRELERLTHVGDLHFRRADRPDVEQWFLPDGDRAGWWVYGVRGSYLEVLRRVEE